MTLLLVAGMLTTPAEAANSPSKAKTAQSTKKKSKSAKKAKVVAKKKKTEKTDRTPASSKKAEPAYCEAVIDGILAENGLGSFAKPDEQKTKLPASEGTGYVFKSKNMQKGEGVYVYAPKKSDPGKIRVSYFHADGKKRNLNFILTPKCGLKEITGIYGATASRFTVNNKACSFAAKNPSSRRPASEAISLRGKSKKEFAKSRKDANRLKQLGARFPASEVRGVYELCDAYGAVFSKKGRYSEIAKRPKERNQNDDFRQMTEPEEPNMLDANSLYTEQVKLPDDPPPAPTLSDTPREPAAAEAGPSIPAEFTPPTSTPETGEATTSEN